MRLIPYFLARGLMALAAEAVATTARTRVERWKDVKGGMVIVIRGSECYIGSLAVG
jgi:hypothetical protein